MNLENITDVDLFGEVIKEAGMLPIVKKLNETFLYSATDMYRVQMTKTVVEGTRIQVNTEAFAPIKYEVSRRQTNAVITKMLMNPDVILIKPQIPMPRALKVFTVKDIKTPGNPFKVFIDVSELIVMDESGNYKLNGIDKLIAYLTQAMVQVIYHIDPTRLFNNTAMIEAARSAFSQMITYIVDYLYKISNTESKFICRHMAAMYFDINLLRRDPIQDAQKIHDSSVKISKLTERQIDIIGMYLDENSFDNIKTFIETLAKVLKISKLTLDVFLNKWIYIYGSGTQFALEYYPAFSNMLTDVYCLAYLNNQKTIEKIVGSDMSTYATKVISLGGGIL